VQIHVTIHAHTLSCSLAQRDNPSPFHRARVPIHMQAEDAREDASRLADHALAMTVAAVERGSRMQRRQACFTFSNVSPMTEQWCVLRSAKECVLRLMSSASPPLPPQASILSTYEVLKTDLRADFIAELDVSLAEARARHHPCCAPSSTLAALLFRSACGGAQCWCKKQPCARGRL
jgi:hypothetical protein